MKNKRPTWCHLLLLFHFLCAQHVSGINISIIRSLRLFCWITTLVVLFLIRSVCVLEFRCGWVGVVSVLQGETCNTDTTPTQSHRNSNTHRTKNNTTNVVIQQNSRKLLMMDILRSETCWAYKEWNKIASDIQFVFYSSTTTMMHGPINIRLILNVKHLRIFRTWTAIVNFKRLLSHNFPNYEIKIRFLKLSCIQIIVFITVKCAIPVVCV